MSPFKLHTTKVLLVSLPPEGLMEKNEINETSFTGAEILIILALGKKNSVGPVLHCLPTPSTTHTHTLNKDYALLQINML